MYIGSDRILWTFYVVHNLKNVKTPAIVDSTSNFLFTVLLITLLLPIQQAWKLKPRPKSNEIIFLLLKQHCGKILLLSGFPRLGCHGSVQRIPWQENVSGPDQGLAERTSVQGMQSNLHRRADGLRPRNEKQVEYLITLLFEQLVLTA